MQQLIVYCLGGVSRKACGVDLTNSRVILDAEFWPEFVDAFHNTSDCIMIVGFTYNDFA